MSVCTVKQYSISPLSIEIVIPLILSSFEYGLHRVDMCRPLISPLQEQDRTRSDPITRGVMVRRDLLRLREISTRDNGNSYRRIITGGGQADGVLGRVSD